MSDEIRNTAASAFAPTVWGTTYLITSELLPAGRPLTAAVLRSLPAGLVLLVITRRLPRGVWLWRSVVLGALNIGVFLALLFVAAYRLPGGVAATITSMQPLLVTLLAWRLLSERLSARAIVLALAGIAGVALLGWIVLGQRLTPLQALGAVVHKQVKSCIRQFV
jgi:probable blue pigment (indigoidine) exporter